MLRTCVVAARTFMTTACRLRDPGVLLRPSSSTPPPAPQAMFGAGSSGDKFVPRTPPGSPPGSPMVAWTPPGSPGEVSPWTPVDDDDVFIPTTPPRPWQEAAAPTPEGAVSPPRTPQLPSLLPKTPEDVWGGKMDLTDTELQTPAWLVEQEEQYWKAVEAARRDREEWRWSGTADAPSRSSSSAA